MLRAIPPHRVAPGFDEFLELARIGFAKLKQDGSLFHLSSALADQLAAQASRWLGKRFSDLAVDAAEQDLLQAAWVTTQYTGFARFEMSVQIQPKLVRYFECTLIKMRDQEFPFYLLVHDISQHKNNEQSQWQSARLYKSMFNSVQQSIISCDVHGKILSINRVAQAWLGVDEARALGADLLTWHDMGELSRRAGLGDTHLGRAEPLWWALTSKARQGTVEEATLHYRAAGGERLPVRLVIAPLKDDYGQVSGFVFVGTDLRETESMRAALAESQALFHLAVESATYGMMILDEQAHIQQVNQAMALLLHTPAEALVGQCLSDIPRWQNWAPPMDWRQPLPQSWKFAVQQEQGMRWLRLHSSCLNQTEHPLWCVQVEDITEQESADMGLRLAASVYEQATEGVYITDAKGLIISVNPSFKTITGYSEHEVLGQHASFLRTEQQSSEFYQELSQHLKGRNHWSGELWGKKKTGEAILCFISISKICNDQGGVERYVAIFNDITLLKEKEERIRYLAYHDALTGLPNRLLLLDRVQQEISRARRSHARVAVLFMDVDRFKLINDTLGHDVGDKLLQMLSGRIQSVLRENDTVARLGGDEFVVVLPDVHDTPSVLLVGRKLIEQTAQPFRVDGHDLTVSVSIGIAMFPDDGGEANTLLRHADSAMYRAKETGRNTLVFFTASLNAEVREKFMMESNLRRALLQQEFILHYQPRLHLPSAKVEGVEALIRWQHPSLGMVPPAQFIPLAEETGLIEPIGDWVLQQACLQAKRWLDAGTPIKMAVNLSARQFRNRELPTRIADILCSVNLPPQWLELELTESMIMHNPEESIIMLQKIKAMGITLAVDDFGTGYSSLSYLKRFPIDVLKIDRSFVRDVVDDADDAAIAESIVRLAQTLRLNVVAEGVETEAQASLLQRMGCYAMQGFLYSPGRAVADFERWWQAVPLATQAPPAAP